MKIIDILKFNRELIKRLREAGIRLKDEQYKTFTMIIQNYVCAVRRFPISC